MSGARRAVPAVQPGVLPSPYADPTRAVAADPSFCSLPNEWPANQNRFFEAFFYSLGSWDLRGRLADLAFIRLVIYGERDTFPLLGTMEWVSGLPRARLLAVADAGHAIVEEQPRIVLRAIEQFLDGQRPAGARQLPPAQVP